MRAGSEISTTESTSAPCSPHKHKQTEPCRAEAQQPRGRRGSSLTEQKQLDVLGGDHPVLLQVFLDGLAPVQSCALLGAQCTSHVSRRMSNPVVSRSALSLTDSQSLRCLSLELLSRAVCYSIRPGLRAKRSRDPESVFSP